MATDIRYAAKAGLSHHKESAEGKITMSCFYDRYGEYRHWLSQQAFTETTKRVYASRIAAFLEYHHSCGNTTLSEESLASATNAFLQHLIVSLEARPSTVNSYLTVIAQFCRFLEWNCPNMKIPRINNGGATFKFLTEAESKQYAGAIDRCTLLRDRVLARLILFAGLRLGECVALNVEDVEVSDPAVLTLSCRAPHLRLRLDQETSILTTDWLIERHGVITPQNTEQALFITKDGKRLSAKGVDFVLRRIGISCGLVVSARVLRNTYVRSVQSDASNSVLSFEPLSHKHKITQTPAEAPVYAQPEGFPGAIQRQ
ncbi:MAG: tyrosine-type recombinase/integrase [Candidatus Obscuribacterales bacterium]|nr:tyrosine-type recombinase/integrase [Candidatus Obscuribacterales bacterium]